MEKDLFTLFARGTLACGDTRTSLEALPWNAHPVFAGVYLKDIVPAGQTGSLMTCHLVRIDPGRAIGRHTHADSVELHEVMGGSGVCVTEQGEVPYVPGTVAVLAANAPHEVRAGAEGLRLFAKFVRLPA